METNPSDTPDIIQVEIASQKVEQSEAISTEENQEDEATSKRQSFMANMLRRKKQGGFLTQEFNISTLVTERPRIDSQGEEVKHGGSPNVIGKKTQFSERMAGIRSGLKSSLNLGIDRAKFVSSDSTDTGSVINLKNCSEDDVVKLQELYRDVFEQKYDLGKFIGEGCSAVVKKCISRLTGKEYAVKIMRNLDEERVLAAKNEFQILKSLRHEHIVSVKEFFITPKDIYMVMELVDGVELFDRISEIEKYDENMAKKIFSQILKGLKYLHSQKICHRDIKPSNILIYKDKDLIKITDFNISKLCHNAHFKMTTHIGTEAFKAPELFGTELYDSKVDLWSAGCVLYTMLSGFQPFLDDNSIKLHKQITGGKYDLVEEPWPSVSEEAKDLIKKLLCIDPATRLSADEALAHSWLQQGDKECTLLTPVVHRMTYRKSIRLNPANNQIRRQSINLYPNIDYSKLFEDLAQAASDESQIDEVDPGEESSPTKRKNARKFRKGTSIEIEPMNPIITSGSEERQIQQMQDSLLIGAGSSSSKRKGSMGLLDGTSSIQSLTTTTQGSVIMEVEGEDLE